MVSDMLSQEEIDALLNGDDIEEEKSEKDNTKNTDLSNVEKDTLGEIGNISMGTAATTLFSLLGEKVMITTPKVSINNTEDLVTQYNTPYVLVDVKYKLGLEGANLLILDVNDVKIIADLMMGGDGKNIEDNDLTEMDLSAISEAMNQMVGSASTSLSEMISKTIDIDPPKSYEMKINEALDNFRIFDANEKFVTISFKMVIGDLIDSEIMQILPIKFAKNLASELLNGSDSEETSKKDTENQKKSNETTNNANKNIDNQINEMDKNNEIGITSQSNNESVRSIENKKSVEQEPVNVKKFDFKSFDKNEEVVYNESIDIIKDIPVEITVELGRTKKKISEILEYGPGTIVELDKIVGESLEIYANNKIIAKGEVVVIDDNFGIRITDIIKPSKRITK